MTRLLTALALGAALAAGGLPAAPALADLNVVDPGRGFPRAVRSYASLDETFARRGTARSTAQVRQVRLGSTREGVVRALGRPAGAYPDGSWYFSLSLDYPQRNRLICQYRVYFDGAERVAETVWRRPQCAAVILGGGG